MERTLRGLFARGRAEVAVGAGVLVAGMLAGPVAGQDLGRLRPAWSGFSSPVYLGSPPGEPNRILVGQLNGVIRVIEDGVLLPTPFLDNRSRTQMAHGLIGVAFPPDYATSRRFYLNYTPVGQNGTPRIARYTTSADPNLANTTEEILLSTGSGGGDHNSGWMDFGIDGYLYIARGDAGGEPQSPDNFQGKILRIDVSLQTGYTSPPDNPFVGIAGLDEIGAMGLRNPWRCGIDSGTGDLYIADVGAASQEEIDYIPAGTLAGRNFGWPCVEGTVCRGPCSCTSPPMTIPIHTYGRSDGTVIIGGTVYRGSAIPRWRGRYFFVERGFRRIFSFRVVNGVKEDVREHTADFNQGLSPSMAFVTSFGTDGAGELYVLEESGRILRLTPQYSAADWNFDGAVNSSDFYSFLNDFFGGQADANGDFVTDLGDFFAYMEFFFLG